MEKEVYQWLTTSTQMQEGSYQLLRGSNAASMHYGLTLSEDEIYALVEAKNDSLKKYRRVELGKGILDKLVFAFCDSQYLEAATYATVLMELQDIFYAFKNETMDELSDEELITFMVEQFNGVCYGDVSYLRDTCLERYSRSVKGGYKGFKVSQGHNEYDQVDEEQRWDAQLYMDMLKELFW